jgi:hypothetical protein
MKKFSALLAAGVAALAVGISVGGAGASAVAAAPAATAPASFSGLTCHGGSFCLATGSYHKAGGPYISLQEAWNGRTWRRFPTPRYFDGNITCGAANFCLAGSIPPKQADRLVAWNGRAWQAFKPQPPSTVDLTCLAAKFCMSLAGDAQSIEGLYPIYWNGGTSWPTMPGWYESQCIGPWCAGISVSCQTGSICFDSGQYCTDDNCDAYVDFQGMWNGTTWGSPIINGTSFQLGHGACAGRSFCMLLKPTTTGASAAITRDWGNSWHNSSTGLAAACHRAGCAQLHALACGSPYSCVALTSKSPTAPPADALIWNGTSWKTAPIARVAGRLPTFTLLSCGSKQNCAAIGTSHGQPVAEHWNGSTWKLTPIPTTP